MRKYPKYCGNCYQDPPETLSKWGYCRKCIKKQEEEE